MDADTALLSLLEPRSEGVLAVTLARRVHDHEHHEVHLVPPVGHAT